jgi:hypothetical protein
MLICYCLHELAVNRIKNVFENHWPRLNPPGGRIRTIACEVWTLHSYVPH